MKGSFGVHLRHGFRDFLWAPVRLGRRRVPYGLLAGALLLLLGLGLALSRSPLMGVLGYESAALMALAMALLTPWNLVHRLAELKDEATQNPVRDDRWELVAGGRGTGWGSAMLLLILIPFAVLMLGAGLAALYPRGIFVRNCDVADGVLWFLGVPCITGFWLVGLAALVMAGVRSPRVAGWLCFAYVVGSLLLVGLKWAYGARVAFFNPIVGAVVLPNYNPIVALNWPFWASRILVACWWVVGWTLFLLAYDPQHHRFTFLRAFTPTGDIGWRIARTVHVTLAAIAIAVTFLLRGTMGLDTPAGYLRAELPAVKETEHFSIFYDPQSPVARTIDEVALLHEYHYRH
ncbi:MAG TPA: hypothetical protein VEI97_13420, partial [bacterium]|nr:hypothetical protein [bacterium]